ncbi:MAG: nitrile hydratase subunit beta [Bryobacteraceae bacterium]
MNGIHDMGGMHGMGPIHAEAEKDEPVFHHPWEARVYVMTRAIGAWQKWNIDTGRYYIERIAPADYLRMSYYEKWFTRNVELLVKTGMVRRGEIETGKPAPDSAKLTPALRPEGVPAVALNRHIASSIEPSVHPRFQVGQTVRARNINPVGHTRLPRYARGKTGKIDLDHGVYNFPDTNSDGRGAKRQHVYSVRFAARELWGDQASTRDSVHIDLWDDYLEHV